MKSGKFFLLIILFIGNLHIVTAADEKNLKILILGDSLSAAYNISKQQGWVNLLQNSLAEQGLNVKLINASISGETTTGGLARLPRLLKQHQPQILVIELGGNDGLRGFDLHYTRRNLEAMLKLAKTHQIKVLLCEIDLPPNYGNRYRQAFKSIYHQLASQYEATLLPFFLADIATQQGMMQADGIHPTAVAQPHISQIFEAALLPLLQSFEAKN